MQRKGVESKAQFMQRRAPRACGRRAIASRSSRLRDSHVSAIDPACIQSLATSATTRDSRVIVIDPLKRASTAHFWVLREKKLENFFSSKRVRNDLFSSLNMGSSTSLSKGKTSTHEDVARCVYQTA
ncbi:MAG: hypothetical protein MUC43_13900 [Pirellula sp.]|nr:hypothetical protein [Pirellula sp.]